jgi:hypothetical protein
MLGRLVKLSVVALAFLVTTTPAWATTKSSTCSVTFKVYLDGVQKCGCLTPCGGQCDCFYACLNCCTGCFTGKACGCVKNCSGKGPLPYYCQNFFSDPCWCIHVKSSTYWVNKGGVCNYAACGCATKVSHGTGTGSA